MTKDFALKEFIQGATAIEQGKDPYEVFDEVKIRSPFSVYFINTRNDFPDNYPAKFDEEFARMIIKTWTKPGQTVLDPMGGSGTIPLIAYSLNRHGLYQDINEDAYRLFKEKFSTTYATDKRCCCIGTIGDSTKCICEVEDNTIDLILTSPPFGLSIDATHDKYGDDPEDLGNAENYDTWRSKMKKILKECFRVLRPNHLLMVETRLRSKDGHTYPLNMWVQEDAVKAGFVFFSEIITVVDYYRMVTYGSKHLIKPIPKHGYLTMMLKPAATVNKKLI